MPARVYSERLLWGRTSGGTQTLVVPVGRRVVIRHVDALFLDATIAWWGLWVAGAPVYYRDTPASLSELHADTRLVAYSGESIESRHAGGDVAWHVAGFMFADT